MGFFRRLLVFSHNANNNRYFHKGLNIQHLQHPDHYAKFHRLYDALGHDTTDRVI